MKIKLLAAVSTAFLHLKGPDGQFLYEGEGDKRQPVGITLYGPGSMQFEAVEERQTARAVKRYKDNEGQVSHVPVAERRTQSAEDLADLTAGFQNIEYDGTDGKPLIGRELHVAVYGASDLGWIKDQVGKWLGDWGKFAPVSAKS